MSFAVLLWKKNKTEIMLIAIALAASIVSTVYFMRQGTVLADGDSTAHLNIARRVVDNITPGFSQLGYVWLPMTHLLMLPLIWINPLYYSGLAGIIVSMFSFIAACLFIYKTALLLSEKRLAGIIAFVFFAANPNVLYMQATPLTEMWYTFALTAGVYYLILWAKQKRLSFLATGSVFLLGAGLSRYDGWFISLAAAAMIFAYEFWKTRSWAKTEAIAIVFGLVAFAGPFLWLLWNYIIFGNPIYFAVGKYSAKAQQADLLNSGKLPSYHNLGNSLLTVFYSGQMIAGWSVLIIGSAAILYIVWTMVKTGQYYKLFFLVLGLQIVYYIVNVYVGNGVIFVPQLKPFKIFNVRYALTFMPFFVIAAGVILSRLKWFALVAVAVVLFEYGFVAAHANIITLNEGVHGYAGTDANLSRIAAGQWLKKHYDGGLILGDVFTNDAVAFYSRVPFRNWVNNGNPSLYSQAIHDPSNIATWVLMRDGDEISGVFNRANLEADGFGVVYKGGDIAFYKKGAVMQVLLTASAPPALVPEVQARPLSATVIYQPYVTYVVKKNDSLSKIARKYLGTGFFWTKLARDNALAAPSLLHSGDTIIIRN